MELTDELRAAVITELIEQTDIILDGSRRTVKMWLLAKRCQLQVDRAHFNELVEFLLSPLTKGHFEEELKGLLNE